MDPAAFSHGEPVTVTELMANPLVAPSVRVVVRATSLYRGCDPFVEGGSAEVELDLSLTSRPPLFVGSLYEVVGEVVAEVGAVAPVIKVRVVHCVDGLDTELYHAAMLELRSFLQRYEE
jgi:hypothetical protein